MKLTEPQAWALSMIAAGKGSSPALLGQRMVERPGAVLRYPNRHHKAQGLGRLGGAMIWRLRKMGLIDVSMGVGDNWHPARPSITSAGRALLNDIKTATEGK